MRSEPLTLLLPPWLVDRFDLPRVIAAGDWTRSEAFALLERFDVSGPERAFVQTLLGRRPNLWLYRCNQRAACGDFIVVDVSPPRPSDRAALVIELKAGAPLVVGGAHVQFARAAEAIVELQAAAVIATPSFTSVFGDPAAVLAHLRAVPP